MCARKTPGEKLGLRSRTNHKVPEVGIEASGREATWNRGSAFIEPSPTAAVYLTQVTVPNMSKELGSSNGPPSVFHMFNENRTYYFESDISALPQLPCTTPETVVHHGVPRLRKSFSQPILDTQCTASIPATAPTGRPSTTIQPVGNIHLPAAIMSTTTYKAPFPTHPSREGSASNSRQESRYQTEPSYSSSSILKSFHHEFKLFGGHTKRDSASAPTSPRRASSPELDLESIRPRTNSDPRKLSLVAEETEKDLKREIKTLQVQHISEEKVKEVKSKTVASAVLSSVPKDAVDGEVMKTSQRSLTKHVMTWFVTPQHQSQTKAGKSEFNAMSPSSF